MKKAILFLAITFSVVTHVNAQNYKLSIPAGIEVPKSGTLTEKDTIYFARVYETWFGANCERSSVGYRYYGSDTARVVFTGNYPLTASYINQLDSLIGSSTPFGLNYTSTHNYLFVAGMRVVISQKFGISVDEIQIVSE